MLVLLYLLFQKLLTEPKVCQNYVSLTVQENVFQFDVSVNDPQLRINTTKQQQKTSQYTVIKKKKIHQF